MPWEEQLPLVMDTAKQCPVLCNKGIITGLIDGRGGDCYHGIQVCLPLFNGHTVPLLTDTTAVRGVPIDTGTPSVAAVIDHTGTIAGFWGRERVYSICY